MMNVLFLFMIHEHAYLWHRIVTAVYAVISNYYLNYYFSTIYDF